jgi:hypothetical protein
MRIHELTIRITKNQYRSYAVSADTPLVGHTVCGHGSEPFITETSLEFLFLQQRSVVNQRFDYGYAYERLACHVHSDTVSTDARKNK